MKHTLVAAFDDLSQAQAAKADLISQHVMESNIELSSSSLNEGQATEARDVPDASHHDDSFGDKVSHFFRSLFGNDDDDKPHRYAVAYPEAYRRGAALLTVTVSTDEEAERVEDVLENNGAIDIDERSASWDSTDNDTYVAEGAVSPNATMVPDSTSAPLTGTATSTDTTAVVDRGMLTPSGATAIPVIEEDLRVGKREVNTGRVRVVSRITERPVEETVTLHEEHAHVERHPVDRPARADELNAFQPGTIEIQETAEEVVVDKSARVVEEVTVGKQSSEHQETVHETLRRTDVDVENEPGIGTRHATLSGTPTDPLKNR
jgi:uncharacterized protein (TIGR02271 family)